MTIESFDDRIEALRAKLREYPINDIAKAMEQHPGLSAMGLTQTGDGPAFRLPSPNELQALMIVLDDAFQCANEDNASKPTMSSIDAARDIVRTMIESCEKIRELPRLKAVAPGGRSCGHSFALDDSYVERQRVEQRIYLRTDLAKILFARGITIDQAFQKADDFGERAIKYREEKLKEAGLPITDDGSMSVLGSI